MLNPQFVPGEHGLFGGHKSEEIRTFFKVFCLYYRAAVKRFQKLSNRLAVASKTIQWGKTIEWVTF